MAVGDVTFWSAAISGFAPTTTSPTAAGWTQLTGTGNLGQSATHLAIIDNGLVRLILDKNVTDGTGVRIYCFNGNAWKQLTRPFQTLSRTPTVTEIRSNSAKFVEVIVSISKTLQTTGTYSASFTVHRGIPAVRGKQVSVVVAGEAHLHLNQVETANVVTLDGGTAITACDHYGDTNPATGTTLTVEAWGMIREIGSMYQGHELIQVTNKQRLFARGQDSGIVLTQVGDYIWWGFMPRTYGLGDGGGANVGNGAYGQLREAEDNYVQSGGAAFAVSSDANASGGKRIKQTGYAVGHRAAWVINFPSPGIYYVLLVQTGTGSPSVDLTVDGATLGKALDSGNSFGTTTCHQLYGPYTITSAGDKAVDAAISNAGAGGDWAIDHVSIFPYEATASTPATQIFPKNLAQSLLRLVTPT